MRHVEILPDFEIKQGWDKNWYAVFKNNHDCDDAANHDLFFGRYYTFASFGQYDNALRLTDN